MALEQIMPISPLLQTGDDTIMVADAPGPISIVSSQVHAP